MRRFCRFLADSYRLQKLTNISGKHLVDYVRHLQENGKAAKAPSRRKLAAIRFWHDQISNTKHKLPSNADLADQAPLERQSFRGLTGTGRRSSLPPLHRPAGKKAGRIMPPLPRSPFYVGLRIHEACRLDTAAVEAWERSGLLTVKGRADVSGACLWRQEQQNRHCGIEKAPSGVGISCLFRTMWPRMPIFAFQEFLREHRPDQGTNPYPLTHHGMRHSYAARQYRAAVDSGASEYRAKLDVSHLLGHGRADVTDVYLASKPENQ